MIKNQYFFKVNDNYSDNVLLHTIVRERWKANKLCSHMVVSGDVSLDRFKNETKSTVSVLRYMPILKTSKKSSLDFT
jgi:hypothetical protein